MAENEPTRSDDVVREFRSAWAIKLEMGIRRTFAKIAGLKQSRSFPVGVKPTEADIAIAQTIARHASPVPEEIARALAWGADEKVLLVLTTIGWAASRGAGEQVRRAGNHALLVALTSSVLPHAMKLIFNQTRPDRKTVLGHVHGISFSGRRDDAFPSGHALHMGALASAAGVFPPGPRRAILAIAVSLSLTRVAILAHWASDVLAGFALGAALERFLRPWTGYPPERLKEKEHARR
jgi:undecaprenyl-diphosphatase